MKIKRFEDIKAWQEARVLVKMVYEAAKSNKGFGNDYKFKEQIQSAAVSIMSNIAEGFSRRSTKEFTQFLFIAKGSIAEVQSQLYIALDQGYISREEFNEIYPKSDEVARLISGFIQYLLSKSKHSGNANNPKNSTNSINSINSTNPKNKAVFLDRDGTIAKDVRYCRRVEDFEILPTVPEAIRLLKENSFRVIVVTNQSGIARGYFTEEVLARIHNKMRDELARYDAWVDAIYYCPHHPDDGCDCRKPKTALFHKAAEEHNIDLQSSYVVGDMQMDIDAGKTLGCKTVLVTTGPHSPAPNPQSQNLEPGTLNSKPQLPDYIASNLLEAAEWITVNTEP